MTKLFRNPIALKKDVAAGGIIAAFALGFGAIAWNYSFGSASQMGPGFFPLVLSAILGCLGITVALKGLAEPGEPIAFVAPARLLCILAAPLAFGLLVRPAGFLPAVLATTLLGTLAAPEMRMLTRLILCSVLAVLTTAVFVWGLGLPLPVLGRWLAF